MIITGDKSKFAFQCYIEEKRDNYILGSLCFWINNEKVGNFETITTISIAVSYLEDFLKSSSRRFFQDSFIMDKEKLFFILYDQAFSGESVSSYSEMSFFKSVFWMDEIGEDSLRDKIGMIMINEKEVDRERIIWKNLKSQELKEAFLPSGYFEKISNDFLYRIYFDFAQLGLNF